MKGERCTIERPLFISSANFQLINICLHRIKKVRFYLHTLTSQQKIRWYRVEYITLFCNGFTGVRSTPKRKAVCSNHIGDAILRKCEGHFSMWKTIFAFFLFGPITKIAVFCAFCRRILRLWQGSDLWPCTPSRLCLAWWGFSAIFLFFFHTASDRTVSVFWISGRTS